MFLCERFFISHCQVLPQVAREVSTPLLNTKKITMVSTGDSEIGAQKLTSEVLGIMASLPETVHRMTGVDITKKMNEVS